MRPTDFLARGETFGLHDPERWRDSPTLAALRLLCNVPRLYKPLVDGFDQRGARTTAALRQLERHGFVAHQERVIVDCLTGETAEKESRRVARYKATAAGRRVLQEAREDIQTFQDAHPKADPRNLLAVLSLLDNYVLDDSHARFGISAKAAGGRSGMEERLSRWWTTQFLEKGYIRQLDEKYADVREVIPEHWRLTRTGAKQVKAVILAYDHLPNSLISELRLSRSRFLDEIDPARIGLTGATDFDHDVQTQRILSQMVKSPRFTDGIFVVEPRYALPCDTDAHPWTFTPGADDVVLYQPDAELRARSTGEDGRPQNQRVIVEYERFQSRRDGWAHIERFLGYLATRCLPFEAAVLAFVVDTDQRRRGYVELIEAFCDHAIEHPELMPPNPVTLAVTSARRIETSSDALRFTEWSRISLPQAGGADTERRPVLHPVENTPFYAYFGRA